MDNFAERILDILGEDVWQYAFTDTDSLCFDDSVREACKLNYCGKYGKNWCCPPGNGTPQALQQKIISFKNALVFTTKHDIEDSFDIEGMGEAHKVHNEVIKKLMPVCDEHGAKLLGAGSCFLCGECTCPDAPCRFPDKAIMSVEAVGINVMQLSKELGINYINGQNTVTYFAAVLFN